MDPQHRILLEVAYEAIVDAGMFLEDLWNIQLTNTVYSQLSLSRNRRNPLKYFEISVF